MEFLPQKECKMKQREIPSNIVAHHVVLRADHDAAGNIQDMYAVTPPIENYGEALRRFTELSGAPRTDDATYSLWEVEEGKDEYPVHVQIDGNTIRVPVMHGRDDHTHGHK